MLRMLLLSIIFMATSLTPSVVDAQMAPKAINRSKAYQVFSDRVVQPPFEAKAISPTEIVSNYQSPANAFVDPVITFKFSINGKDNEMAVGVDHRFACLDQAGSCETPLIVFGEPLKPVGATPSGVYLKPETSLHIRLDLRKVFEQFSARGYFETFNGSKIYKDDFKSVFVAGSTAPLTWDFDNLHNYKHLELKDDDGDHIYDVTLVLNSAADRKKTSPAWKKSLDTEMYPQYKSDYVLWDALYNLSLEEMIKAVEKDSTLRTGKEWAGVWTRDVSYSIILSMAILQTKVAQNSLMRKVKDGVIIQDTGTGGAYPISTDRMVWAIAAWEIYKVTGDKRWLADTYAVVKKSLEADLQNAVDSQTGLVLGESSFLDWREQTYPEWMQPADIFESQCLGTNAVHFQAHHILAMMAKELRDETTSAKHERVAGKIKDAMNTHLWLPKNGYYGQFRYGRVFKILSPRSEALGEALSVLFDVADPVRQRSVVERTPIGEFGIPCIFPQIPGIPPYHNNGVWPFVQSYWTMAAAKVGNEFAVTESLCAIQRPAALFLTNKENFVALNGDYAATQINSDNMLWSLSGNIAMIYKVLFGMQYTARTLEFRPFVPAALQGRRTLNNFRYRDAILDIELDGYGNEIKSFSVDGTDSRTYAVSADLQGRHHIKIVLANNSIGGDMNMATFLVSPAAPAVQLKNGVLSWAVVPDAQTYRVLRNGVPVAVQSETKFQVGQSGVSEFQVIAINSAGLESFASEPILSVPSISEVVKEVEDKSNGLNRYKGYSGNGYVMVDLKNRPDLRITVDVAAADVYRLDVRYANGNGPVNTENKCGIRTLYVNGQAIGSIVLPQRGTNEWSDWGYSNGLLASLKKGLNTIDLKFESHNTNMHGEINEAAIDAVRLVRVGKAE
jgi:hypothetical protein